MHEPDEQGLGAVVIGRGLDNAFCAHDFDPNPPRKGLNLTLLLRRDDGQILNLNIADLLALARVADIGKILDIDQES